MLLKVNVLILGVVENMSHFVCDGYDKKHYLFGKERSAEHNSSIYTYEIIEELNKRIIWGEALFAVGLILLSISTDFLKIELKDLERE